MLAVLKACLQHNMQINVSDIRPFFLFPAKTGFTKAQMHTVLFLKAKQFASL